MIVGNDHDIPFFRYPDASGLGTESNYVPPVSDNTPSQASLRLNYVLSQDAYGASTILHLNGLDLPVPDLAVGRLVETPAEISGMLDAYTAAYSQSAGTASVTPTSSLVTGYDFLSSAANEVQADFSAALGAGNADSLINPSNPPTAPWTADALRQKLLGSSHGLIFLAGHFSANNTLAADFSTTMNSTEVAASSTNFENSIVFSAGCHSGYNIVNEDGIANVTQPVDWVEAFAQKQATVIAGTGYQYGDTDFVAYSAKLYASFAKDLTAGSVGVGAALVDAKQQYLDDTTQLSGIDVKSLLEATLYGLPMLDVTMPGNNNPAPLSAAVQASAPTPITPTGATSLPGGGVGGLGLSSANVHFDTGAPSFSEQNPTLTDGQNSVKATYIQGPDGVVTAPGEPTLPLLSTDVTVAGQVLRGVGFIGGAFTDEGGVTPLTGDPGTDQDGTHTPFASSTFFPEMPWSVNYFSGLANGSTGTQLLLTPAQYETDGPGTDVQRQFTSLDLRLFYSTQLGAGGPCGAPVDQPRGCLEYQQSGHLRGSRRRRPVGGHAGRLGHLEAPRRRHERPVDVSRPDAEPDHRHVALDRDAPDLGPDRVHGPGGERRRSRHSRRQQRCLLPAEPDRCGAPEHGAHANERHPYLTGLGGVRLASVALRDRHGRRRCRA